MYPTILVPLVLLTAVSCSSEPARDRTGPPRVVVSIGAFEVLANAIGGDAVTITNIARGAGDAHEIELTPSQSESLRTADLAVLPQRGFQVVVDDAASSRPQGIVRLGPNATSGGAPHFWVDPRQLAGAARKLGAAFQALNVTPARRTTIRERTREVVRSLELLAAQYDERLSSLGQRVLAAEHASMETLGNRYRFRVDALSGTAHDAEPTPGQLQRVAAGLKSSRVRTILVEPSSKRAVAYAAIRAAGISDSNAKSHIAVFDNFELISPAQVAAARAVEVLRPLTTGYQHNLASLCSALECEP